MLNERKKRKLHNVRKPKDQKLFGQGQVVLSSFKSKNWKSTMKNLKNKGKEIFLERIIWTMKGKKERNQEKQISKEKERDKNYNAIKKEKKEKRKKEGDDE